jgi:DNA-binding HxlR family transcriptional regulator
VADAPRSHCPINLSLELFGDRWTLLILRDIVFGDLRRFRELLASTEGISSNILADRLRTLVRAGVLTRTGDPGHRQKVVYRLTEAGIGLVPVLVQVGAWGQRFLPASPPLAARAQVLAQGGPPMWEALMDELREAHLGTGARRHPVPAGPPVREILQRAYDRATSNTDAGGAGRSQR